MTKWDFLFYNFVAMVDVLLLFGAATSFVSAGTKAVFGNLSACVSLLVDKYYEAKKEFIDKLSKDDKDFLDRTTGQNKRGYN